MIALVRREPVSGVTNRRSSGSMRLPMPGRPAGRNSGSSWPKGMVERRPAVWVAFLLVGVLSMNEAKSKKNAPVHDGFEWAGAVARVRRGGRSRSRGPSGGLARYADRRLCQLNSRGRISDRSGGERRRLEQQVRVSVTSSPDISQTEPIKRHGRNEPLHGLMSPEEVRCVLCASCSVERGDPELSHRVRKKAQGHGVVSGLARRA